jgi:NAD+ kinase
MEFNRITVLSGKEGIQFLDSAKIIVSIMRENGLNADLCPNWECMPESKDLDLLVVLGGDGTFLRSVQYLGKDHLDIPILSINYGHLGFLTACESSGDDVEKMAHRVSSIIKNNEYSIMNRHILEYSLARNGFESHGIAVNEVLIGTAEFGKMIEVEVTINNKKLTVFSADGVIVASPTGSTGYSLSAGGPIMHPSLNTISLTAIAPHSLSARPIVLPGTEVLKIREINGHPLMVSADGNTGMMIPPSGTITVLQSNIALRQMILPESPDFYDRLHKKLHWDGSIRNGTI